MEYKPKQSNYVIKKETSGVEAKEDSTRKIDGEGNQTFTTEELGWKIWDYDGTTIRLISAIPTTETLTLNGATGYNNGVYAMNEICRQCYGTGEKGVEVSNLRRSDIQKVSTYDYTKYKHTDENWGEDNNGTIQFGNKKTYGVNYQYPKMWEKDKDWTYEISGGKEIGSDKECLIWEKEYNRK